MTTINPNLKIYAYTMASTTWCGSGYALGSYYRDYWMNAQEAVDYGLIARIINSRSEL